LRRSLAKRVVRPMGVEVGLVLAEHLGHVSVAEDPRPVRALAARAADPSLADGVRVGRLRGSLDDLGAGAGETG
jgi:hypothetical protein